MYASYSDGVSDIDDAKSVVTKSGNSSGDSIRSKMQKEYTKEECYTILSGMGLGYSPDQAAKRAKSLTENVKSVELLDPRRMTTGSEKLSDVQIGRNVFEAVRNMIAQGNEPLIAVVKTNYPLETFLSDLQTRMFEIEEAITQLEQSYKEPVEPKEDRLKLRLEVDLEQKEEELRNNALKDFKERTEGTGSDMTRSRSRGRVTLQEADQSEDWAGSPEHQLFENRLASYVKVQTRKYKEDLLKLYTAYDQQVDEKESAVKELKKQRDEMRRQQVQEIFVSEIQKQCNIIVQKVKTALMSYSFIREKLAKNVIVNGDSIVQPLATENLSGMFALLHQEYNKITMGAFCDYLMALMSESSSKEESSKNPQVQLKRMDKHLKMWLDMDLEKFMTPDHLFTICLLRSYHPDTVIRSDGVRHILEYSRRLDTDITLKAAVGEYANMPLYTELVRWINDVHVKSMQFSNSAKGSPANTMSNAPQTSQTDKKSPSLELAATAISATGASATAASENTNGPRRNQRPYFHPRNKTYASGPYHAEVYRTSDLCAKSGFPYQALTNPCVSCNHIPRCLGKQCPKCHYWGHNATDCCQVVRKPDAGDAGQR